MSVDNVMGPLSTAPRQLVTLQLEAFLSRLSGAESALTDASPVVSLPLPDGQFLRFRMQRTAVMDPALEATTSIRTFRGVAIDDPSLVVRLEATPNSIRSMVLSSRGRFVLEPLLRSGDPVVVDSAPVYVSFTVGTPKVQAAPIGSQCLVREVTATPQSLMQPFDLVADPVDKLEPAGSVKRTYRLAIGATAEYTALNGGTVDAALAEIVSTMQWVNEIFGKDLAVTFRLVGQKEKLIHLDPDKDPYHNDDLDKTLTDNAKWMIDTLGTDAFDIAHVFSTGPGGKAEVGSVCGRLKAHGVTGSRRLKGERFAVDYVSHELAHQLGANHSFNSVTGACAQRHRSSAWEPGSGSTVMGYAGLCQEANLQLTSHPYFHAGSLAEMRSTIVSGPGTNCGTKEATKNRPPVVTVAAESLTVPVGTAFILEGAASDDPSQTVSFVWEQMDLGPEAPPDDDIGGKLRPLFRSRQPIKSPVRTLPDVAVLVAGIDERGETMASTARDLHFRLTARDNLYEAGGVAFAGLKVTVVSAGPFALTEPAGKAVWSAGGQATVQWGVGGTDVPPISAARVRILLSTDGGLTYPLTLSASTPNDGVEIVAVPLTTSSTAVLWVEALPPASRFFAVSQTFQIRSSTNSQVVR